MEFPLPEERFPLLFLSIIRAENGSERDGRFGRECSFPSSKCRRDRSNDFRPIKLNFPGENPDIEEIFHPAISESEKNHRLEFLGHDGCSGICREHWCWKIEKRRVLNR